MAERALHIGIDGRELVRRPPGVGRYVRSLLRQWLPDGTLPHRFTVFLTEPPPPDVVALGGPITWAVIPAEAAGTRFEQTTLVSAINRATVDVLFAPAYTAPLLVTCPVVLTIHDLSYFAHPEWFSRREGLRRRWITWASAKRATSILAISDFSAKEIVTRLGVSASRVHAVPHGPPTIIQPSVRPPREPMVLFVGSMFTRRRVPDLIRAFAQLLPRLPDARLVLVGDNQMEPPVDPRALALEVGAKDRVEWRAWVSDEELDHLYWSARAFAFLSEYEGFALTPMEAIGHEVPAVLLDTPVAREIYRDAAQFVPLSTEAIATALTSLLTDGPARAAALARGRELLTAYSWPRSARAVLRVIEHAARGQQAPPFESLAP